jgi:hypothetical protein
MGIDIHLQPTMFVSFRDLALILLCSSRLPSSIDVPDKPGHLQNSIMQPEFPDSFLTLSPQIWIIVVYLLINLLSIEIAVPLSLTKVSL